MPTSIEAVLVACGSQRMYVFYIFYFTLSPICRFFYFTLRNWIMRVLAVLRPPRSSHRTPSFHQNLSFGGIHIVIVLGWLSYHIYHKLVSLYIYFLTKVAIYNELKSCQEACPHLAELKFSCNKLTVDSVCNMVLFLLIKFLVRFCIRVCFETRLGLILYLSIR